MRRSPVRVRSSGGWKGSLDLAVDLRSRAHSRRSRTRPSEPASSPITAIRSWLVNDIPSIRPGSSASLAAKQEIGGLARWKAPDVVNKIWSVLTAASWVCWCRKRSLGYPAAKEPNPTLCRIFQQGRYRVPRTPAYRRGVVRPPLRGVLRRPRIISLSVPAPGNGSRSRSALLSPALTSRRSTRRPVPPRQPH